MSSGGHGIKLLVDICPLLRRRTGVGNYIYYLLRELLEEPQIVDIVGVCGTRFWQREALHELVFSTTPALHGEGDEKHGRVKRWLRQVPYSREVWAALQTGVLLSRWRKYRDYIFWGGNFYLPRYFPGKCVLTIHDLSHIHYTGSHPAERVRFLNKRLLGAIRQADVITVVSETTRQDVEAVFGKLLKLPPLTVVSPAVGDHFRKPRSHGQDDLVRKKYRLPEKYILSVGTLEPRKNLLRLCDAYTSLPKTVQAEWPLLLVGDSGWLSQDLYASLKAQNHIRWLGYVPDADMPSVYGLASIFAYISLFEGFGMPILEAMSTGVPVVTSDRGAMKEVAGDAACLVNPESVTEISQTLAQVIMCTNIRENFRMKGEWRQQNQTWGARKEDMLKVLQTLDI